IQQPTEKLLLLPLAVKTPADSGVSIATMDAARARLEQLAKYKVLVIPKAKLCDALKASDFACDVLLDDAQALLLARFLNVNAYTIGTLERSSGLVAHIRVRDIGSSGYAALFTVSSGNPATAAALGEAIAQKLNAIVRAGEQVRDCNDLRQKSQFAKALEAARKALATEPNLPGAHLCVATVYEAQRMPVDSQLAAYHRAAALDSLNGTAWENIARLYQQKGDTLKAIDAYIHELHGEPQNTPLPHRIHELLRLFVHTATRHFPKHAAFWEALGAAFDLKGQRDSSVWAYKQAFAIDPNRYNTALLIAKTIVEGTVYDTAHAPPKSDSVILK